MVEGCALPAVERVALGAVSTKLPAMDVVLPVAGIAFLRCAVVGVARVTIVARSALVTAQEWKDGQRVVEGGLRPRCRCVAGVAGSGRMGLRRDVTGRAFRRRTLVGDVARGAVH